MQSVFSLMMSSKLVEVQCEAAALLVELTAAPKILEVMLPQDYSVDILCNFRVNYV